MKFNRSKTGQYLIAAACATAVLGGLFGLSQAQAQSKAAASKTVAPAESSAAASTPGDGLALAGTPVQTSVRAGFMERFGPSAKVDEVRLSPFPGVYEVRVGGSIVYSNADVTYFLSGNLVDAKTKANVTQERLAKINAIDFSTLPLKDALVQVKGDGKRKLAVFADPNCGYCKRFEKELESVDNVTVYTFLMPILGDDSVRKANDIWCSPDKAKAWEDWMLHGTAPKAGGSCDLSSLKRVMDLAQKLNINGTPHVIFESGVRNPGMMAAADVEKGLSGAKPARN